MLSYNLATADPLFLLLLQKKNGKKKTSLRGFRFPSESLEPTKKTASVFLDLSREDWQICVRNFLSLHPLASPLGRGV